MRFTCVLISLFLVSCSQSAPQSGSEPAVISQVRPGYPVVAYNKHAEGIVKVVYDVDADGNVRNPVAVSDTSGGLFSQEAVIALSRWKYEKNKPRKGMKKSIVFMINHKPEPQHD